MAAINQNMRDREFIWEAYYFAERCYRKAALDIITICQSRYILGRGNPVIRLNLTLSLQRAKHLVLLVDAIIVIHRGLPIVISPN